MNDRTQLKQEEVVGNDVVLNDINPKTNTNSVDDSVSGTPLNQTIDRIWNAINNKLSRIVNSVNGRTGVVVLHADDVGLGNVDNVSYADIKNWVIERITEEFDYKDMMLCNNFSEVNAFINEHLNDRIFANKIFYCAYCCRWCAGHGSIH